jgi:hypothetical protein
MAYPFGRWVLIDRMPEEPVIAYVYLDAHAGPSAKGGLASDMNLATMPSRTVRLSPTVKLSELDDAECAARKLPANPTWLSHYGPQPLADAPWRHDPNMRGKFHKDFPDDIQALVHDGDPRVMRRGPELCWVRIQRVDRAATRPVTDVIADHEKQRAVYIGELLNAPHTLQSVKRGDRLKLLSVAGMPHPLHVTDAYLQERLQWEITPCDKCGATETFDPPSVMAKVRFPNAPVDAMIAAFTSICSHCGGMQQLTLLDA